VVEGALGRCLFGQKLGAVIAVARFVFHLGREFGR
jgi:hypothetical protein